MNALLVDTIKLRKAEVFVTLYAEAVGSRVTCAVQNETHRKHGGDYSCFSIICYCIISIFAPT